MSNSLLDIVEQFLGKEITGAEFADKYIDDFRHIRDEGSLPVDDPKLNGKLTTFFSLADLFNGDYDREDYELDETKLRDKIQETYDADSVDDVLDFG